jgi:hypothetical protein
MLIRPGRSCASRYDAMAIKSAVAAQATSRLSVARRKHE